MQSLTPLTGLTQHLATVMEIAVDVTHRVTLKLRNGILHLREAVIEA
tara:strand:+ start:638 stop:778 length:141 start_codon:yes stop_codon:yes gene_type:complete